jgi:hypothetical protein
MEIKFNIEKSQRKTLAQKIGELTGADVKYLGVPGCGYQIDFFTLDKNAVLSFSDRSDTEIVEKVLTGLADAGYESETVMPPEGTDASAKTELETESEEQDAPDEPSSGFPLTAEISFPLADHTVQSLTNLICMIHSRGTLLSKATCGAFSADKSLVDEIGKHEFRSIHELITFIREWEETNPELKGIRFADDKVIFDGFGEAADADHVQTFMKLAGAMNHMAITQKRVQAKDVDDSNEKYALRIWLIRLGLNGADCKADRKHLMAPLSGHTAFRNDAERMRWEAKQKAKRDAAKAEQTEEEKNNAVSE